MEFCVSLRLHISAVFLTHSLAMYVNVITRIGMRRWEEGGQRDHHHSSFLCLFFTSVRIPCLPVCLSFQFSLKAHLFYFPTPFSLLQLTFCVFPHFNHSLYIQALASSPSCAVPVSCLFTVLFFQQLFSLYSLSSSPHSPLNHHSLPSSINSCFFFCLHRPSYVFLSSQSQTLLVERY